MRRTAAPVSIVSCLLALACATPVQKPVDVQPVTPAAGQTLVVDHSILIVDESGSISRMEQYPGEKALAQSLVASMPAGKYEAGANAFGGTAREVHPLATFDRAGLGSWAGDLTYLSEGTPLDQALAEAGAELKGKSDNAAITVLSDGIPTDVVGREVPAQKSLDAAAALSNSYQGKVCIHTVQVGNDAGGAAFLEKLSNATGCGSHRSASSLSTAAAIQNFQRDVYFASAPVAKDGDDDEDGVRNSKDRCPNTPKLVRVDDRGCWASRDVYFETNSAVIDESSKELLRTLGVAVLKANPDLRVRVDGHTDSRGSDAYNQQLSQKRAAAVRDFFIAEGIDPKRLESRGFGESEPAAPNDSAENMRLNRRVEFTPL